MVNKPTGPSAKYWKWPLLWQNCQSRACLWLLTLVQYWHIRLGMRSRNEVRASLGLLLIAASAGVLVTSCGGGSDSEVAGTGGQTSSTAGTAPKGGDTSSTSGS